MEASAVKNKSQTKAKPMSELLPSLSGLWSTDELLSLTVKKKQNDIHKSAQSHTAEKMIKPLTLEEMRSELFGLKQRSPRRANQIQASEKKKGWNSSVKVDRKISHTAGGQLKKNAVRKVLNFQPMPKANQIRMTMQHIETPKYLTQEFRAKKSLYHIQAKNNVRISGICNIPPTPVEEKPLAKTRMTITNKENLPRNSIRPNNKASVIRPNVPKFGSTSTAKENKIKIHATPKHKKIPCPNIDTPLSNASWKLGSDSSFLLKEKEIHDVEEAILQEKTLEKIAEVSPPISTPFKEYRSVQEYFNNSSCLENSAVFKDNTIMCFDKPSICNENEKREESVIVTLCDLFNKASVTNTDKSLKENDNLLELDNLLEVEKETVKHIEMIENGIQMLTAIKGSQTKYLQKVSTLITEKKKNIDKTGIDNNKTLVAETTNKVDVNKTLSPESPIISKPCSVIKSSKSPSYKIPRKSLGLRKKIISKSTPNVSTSVQSPVKVEGKALNMYMKMKEQMNFLSTPNVNHQVSVPDTPALISRNLQKQLDNLFAN